MNHDDESAALAHQLELENRRREDDEMRAILNALDSCNVSKLADLLYNHSPVLRRVSEEIWNREIRGLDL